MMKTIIRQAHEPKPKRTYEKPAMQVFEMKVQTGILQASKPDYDPTSW